MALTIKQERFAREYHRTGNASAAYRHAYDAENMADNSIAREASLLKGDPNIAQRIAQLSEHELRRHQATADRVIAEISKLAFVDMRLAFDEEGNLKPLSEWPDEVAAALAGLEFEERFDRALEPGEGFVPARKLHTGRIHKIKVADKLAALEKLCKHLNLFADDNKRVMAVEIPDFGREKLSDEQLARLIALADGEKTAE